MTFMAAGTFEALVRSQLAERDRKRRSRIGDPGTYAEADQACVTAIMEAAGYAAPDEGEQVVRRARRSRKLNEAAALGGDA